MSIKQDIWIIKGISSWQIDTYGWYGKKILSILCIPNEASEAELKSFAYLDQLCEKNFELDTKTVVRRI